MVAQRLVVNQECRFDDLLEEIEEEVEIFSLKLPLMNRP